MDKVGRIRTLLVLLPVLLLASAQPALAARHTVGCGAPAGSAINQYCEALPTATGGKQPKIGTPSVAKTLPPRVVHELAQAGPAAQRLLTLPAAAHHRRKPSSVNVAGLSGPDTSAWSLSVLMIVLLALAALGLGGVAYERRRGRRAAGRAPRP
jgi:hypothetical protein